MNRITYSKLFIYPLMLLLAHSVSYGQVSLVNSGSSHLCAGNSDTLSTNNPFDSYLWSTGETTATIIVDSDWDYYVTVTDSLSNTFNSDTITIQTVDVNASTSITSLICNGDNDGEIDILFVSEGDSPFTYLWSNGATTEDLIGLSGGDYTVTITEAGGCTGVLVLTVGEPDPVSIVPSVTNASCAGATDGAINITAQGGVGDYTFEWSGAETTEDISGLAAGSYVVTVTDFNGCAAIDTIEVGAGAAPEATITGSLQVCISATTTLDAGSGFSAYLWSTGATTQTLSAGAGTYTVTVTNGSGCTAIDSATVTEFSAPAVSIAATSLAFCEGDSSQLTATTGFVSYLWSTGETTESIYVNADGAYQVTVTDINGCTGTASEEITVNDIPGLDIISLQDVLCFGQSNGIIEVEGIDGTTPYQYQINGGGYSAVSLFTGLSAGFYDISVLDSNGCSSITQFLISEPDSLAPAGAVTNISCNGNGDGSIDLEVTGGTFPYDFLWSNSSTIEDQSLLTAGTYTVTVTDAGGCTATAEFNVSEPGAILISGVPSDESCAGADGEIDITVTGGTGSYTYSWSNGSTNEDLTGLVAGTYTVQVTDQAGCTNSESFTVGGGGGSITPVITGPSTVCPGGTVILDAGAGYASYLWSGGETTQTVSAVAGTYTVTVTIPSGCSGTSAGFTVNENTAPSVSITAGGPLSFCSGGSVTLTATAGFSYLWSGGETTDQVTATANGNYIVTVTDINGCTATAAKFVTVFPVPAINLINLVDVACKDDINGEIEFEGTGGTAPYLYDVNNGGFTSQTLYTGLAPGVYDITVQDSNGCTAMSQYFINEPVDYLSASYSTTDVLCFGDATGSIDLTVSGGTVPYTYEWSNADTAEDPGSLVAGTYTVTVTDAHGCTLLFAIDIYEPTQLVVGQDYTNISCFGGSDGTAIVFVSGGVPDYTYSWNTNPVQTDFVAFNLDAGTHQVTITDANGCVVISTFLISEPPQLSVSASVTDVSCFGFADGSATVTGTGGTPYLAGNPYTYSWNTIPVQTTQTATGLAAGSYTLTVIDSAGCQTSAVVSVDEPNQLMASTSNVNVLCNGGNNGESTVIVSGGTAPYIYLWNTVPAQTTQIATGLTAGLYTVTVTDDNGCSTTANALINQPAAIILTGTPTPVICFRESNGQVLLTVNGGDSPYSYFWNTAPATTVANLNNVPAGSYTVIVTDQKGCTASGTYVVTQPAQLQVTETITPVNCFGGLNGSVTTVVSGGTPAYTYLWSNGSTTSSITNVAAGSYTLTVTDANNCVVTKVFLVGGPADINIGTTVSNVACNGGADGSILISVSGGTAPYSYLWSNGATTAQITNLAAGNYDVTVTDAHGCTKQVSIAVTQPAGLTCVCNASVVNVSCFGGSNGSITAQPMGGTPPYSYLWSNGQLTQTANGLVAGTYTVTITDANGCQAVGVISITQPQLLFVFATSSNITCNGAANGTGNAIVTGGTQPYSYSWNTIPVQTTQAATGLTPGTFTVTVTDANGCTAFTSVTISQPGSLNCSTSSTNVTCNGASNGTATVVASGGASPFTYLWNTVPAKTTTTVIGLAAGTYTVTITDANGCTKTCQATVSQPSNLVALYVPTNVLCFGGSTGAIDLTVTGGTAPYTYNWSNGGTTQDLSGLAAGVYTVVVTDHKGCNITAVVTLTQPAAFTCSTTSTNVSCFGGLNGTATVSANGGVAPYSYLWSNGNTTSNATGLAAGAYTVTVTDHNACTTFCGVNINEPPVLTCSVKTCCDTILCYGDFTGALEVTVAGGTPPYTYVWNTVPVQTSSIASGLGAGSYTVTVTDSKGCTTSCSYTLSQPDPLTCNTLGNNVTCHGGSDGTAIVYPNGGTQPYTYIWNTVTAQTTATATGLSAGTYTVFVTDANGCTTSCSVLITEPAVITLNITHTDITCNGLQNGTANVTGSGGMAPFSYLWSNGETTSSVTGLAVGTYTVTVTDANSCSASASVTILEPAAITCSTTSTNVSCNGGSNGTATVTASGGTAPLSYTWNTVPVQHTVTAIGLTAGTYVVTISDANGCSTTCSATITEPGALSCSTSVIQNVTCNGGADGSAEVTASGGTGLYTFAWTTAPVQTTATATGLEAGNYGVTVTDQNGCSTTCTVTITQPDPLTCSTTANETNCGNSDGTATVTTTGGTPPYAYLWSDGQTTQTATGLAAGDYTVTVTDSSSCTTSCTASIGASSDLIAIISGTDVSCHGGSDGQAIIIAAGGEPPYTYLWNTIPAQTTDTVNGLAAGTYTVVVTDLKGCTISKTITINEPPAINISIATNDVLCAGGNTGSATANPSGGISPYDFVWSNGQTTQTATGLSSGTYTVTVSDFNGCTATASAVINEPQALSCSLSPVNPTCYNSSNGSITVNPSGGTAPYAYLWSNGQTTQTATGLVAGSYTVTVTDSNGCTTSCNTTLSGGTPPDCLISGSSLVCSGGSTQLCAPAGLSAYLWSTGATTQCITVSQTGSYTVTVTNGNGCTSSCDKSVTVDTPPGCLISGNSQVCSGGSTQLCAPAGLSAYLWSTGATTQCITVSQTGNYTVTVTNSNGCTSSCDKSVTVGTPPNCQINGNSQVCSGGSTQLCAPAGLSAYLWSTGATTQCITASQSTTYTVTVTNNYGCTSSCQKSVTISNISIVFTKVVHVSCFGGNNGTAEANPSGGTPPYSYQWSNGATVAFITGLQAGVYTVTVTDANGCTGSAAITITQPNAMNVTINKTNVTCHGAADGTATASVTGGSPPYSYSWNTIPVKTTASISGLAPGTYTVTVTDFKGCVKTKSVTITQPPAITISFTKVVHVGCNGGNTGTAEANPSGGTPGYTYLWSNGQTVAFITGLSAGTYTVTVTDTKGCTKSASVTINQSSAVSCSIVKTDANCAGSATGTATVTASGGTPPYTYLWNTVPAKTTASVTGLAAGSYSVTVTDVNGCSSICSALIYQPSPITIGFTKVVQPACYGSHNGTAEANPSGGTPGYSFLWSNGQTVPFITGLTAGTYTVTVTDSKGCTKSASLTLSQPSPLSCSTSVTNAGCNGATGSATVNPQGGTGPYSYSWNTVPVKTTQTVTGLTAGTYTVTVTDSKGCSSTCQAVVGTSGFTLSLTSPVYVGGKNIRCNGDLNGSINLTVNGASGNIGYLWSNGATTEDLSNIGAGTYTVTVTSGGCTQTASIILTQPAAIVITISKTNVSCNGGSNGSATANVSGGTAPYTYSWNTNPVKTTATVTGLLPGSYTVTVGDANGCTKTGAVSITQPSKLNVTGVVTNVSCNGGNNGSINITASGGTSPYGYLWNNGSTIEDRSSLSHGTYTVTVTDHKGCKKTLTFCVSQPSAISATITTNNNVSCNGGSNGKLTVSASGGTSPYTYSWNTIPVKTTASISGLVAGTYTVTITDSKGCVKTASKAVTQPALLIVNMSFTDITVSGANNGTATASPSGGISPYTYSWNTSPVKTTQTITGLAAGSYTVIVTDFKGCTKSGSVIISAPSACQSFKSYTNSGWANNGLSYLNSNFAAAFPNGLTIGDCGRTIKLTTSAAVVSFLPSSGTPRRLDPGTLTNPGNSYGNSLASQLVALKLTLVFDAYDANFAPTSTALFKDLIISSGPFMGWTVEQLYNEANYKIGCGGCSSSYYSSLKSALISVNESWKNGVSCSSFLVCPGTSLRGTGIPDEKEVLITGFKMYPNPTNGFINLEFNTKYTDSYQVYVTDMTGRTVYTEKSITEEGLNGKFYDFTTLPKGIYIFQFNIGTDTHTSRIVIQ